MIVTSGNGEILVGGKKVSVGPGSMMYCESNQLHGVKNTGSEPLGDIGVVVGLPNQWMLSPFFLLVEGHFRPWAAGNEGSPFPQRRYCP